MAQAREWVDSMEGLTAPIKRMAGNLTAAMAREQKNSPTVKTHLFPQI